VDLASIPWVQGSLVTLALAVIFSGFWMVFRGLLVPRSVVEDVRKDRDVRVAEARAETADYKAAWMAMEKARHEQDNQLAELMELARASNQLIQALGRREEGPRHVVAP
jgi:hypothetical protein